MQYNFTRKERATMHRKNMARIYSNRLAIENFWLGLWVLCIYEGMCTCASTFPETSTMEVFTTVSTFSQEEKFYPSSQKTTQNCCNKRWAPMTGASLLSRPPPFVAYEVILFSLVHTQNKALKFFLSNFTWTYQPAATQRPQL